MCSIFPYCVSLNLSPALSTHAHGRGHSMSMASSPWGSCPLSATPPQPKLIAGSRAYPTPPQLKPNAGTRPYLMSLSKAGARSPPLSPPRPHLFRQPFPPDLPPPRCTPSSTHRSHVSPGETAPGLPPATAVGGRLRFGHCLEGAVASTAHGRRICIGVFGVWGVYCGVREVWGV